MSHYLLTILWSLIVGAYIGWVCAHSVVAKECKRLGGFYVSSTVFKCVEVKESE